ncbi:hypothetical protein RHMOL_Rhmol09G0186800 [Rhododendron molle]|uniref:Uncharacterized protein n=1 Tax=Rhododendron molle TaxID=49168 RepID=A0ACC0MGJ8_RHOML|nr:hypothetical protein RHMOL_Rhmol09G0186800 [Rhododendron molle]
MQISTDYFDVINQEINLEINGSRMFLIRVMEEQVVVSNLTRAVCDCKCKRKDSLKTKNLVLHKEDDDEWSDDSIAEDNHQFVVDPLNEVPKEVELRATPIPEESHSLNYKPFSSFAEVCYSSFWSFCYGE